MHDLTPTMRALVVRITPDDRELNAGFQVGLMSHPQVGEGLRRMVIARLSRPIPPGVRIAFPRIEVPIA